MSREHAFKPRAPRPSRLGFTHKSAPIHRLKKSPERVNVVDALAIAASSDLLVWSGHRCVSHSTYFISERLSTTTSAAQAILH